MLLWKYLKNWLQWFLIGKNFWKLKNSTRQYFTPFPRFNLEYKFRTQKEKLYSPFFLSRHKRKIKRRYNPRNDENDGSFCVYLYDDLFLRYCHEFQWCQLFLTYDDCNHCHSQNSSPADPDRVFLMRPDRDPWAYNRRVVSTCLRCRAYRWAVNMCQCTRTLVYRLVHSLAFEDQNNRCHIGNICIYHWPSTICLYCFAPGLNNAAMDPILEQSRMDSPLLSMFELRALVAQSKATCEPPMGRTVDVDCCCSFALPRHLEK